jgi:hypothetical protein
MSHRRAKHLLESKDKPLASRAVFAKRLLKSFGITFGVILVSLFGGMCGYHFLEDLPWLDAFVNAAMILSGMGPVNPMQTPAGKLFAGCYAIYSGLLLIGLTGFMLAPVFHRMLHIIHLDEE